MNSCRSPASAVDLYWIPLGAGVGGRLVRASGRVYESLAARAQQRPPVDLFHSALVVRSDGHDHAIEMAPVWATRSGDRGVVSEGPVGFAAWGRLSLFRYEVRCWRDGTIPDVAAAIDSPRRMSADEATSRRVLDSVPHCPSLTWGRDESHTGDMWNSNSLISWLLVGSGHDIGELRPPGGGRAAGWVAGAVVAGGTGR